MEIFTFPGDLDEIGSQVNFRFDPAPRSHLRLCPACFRFAGPALNHQGSYAARGTIGLLTGSSGLSVINGGTSR